MSTRIDIPMSSPDLTDAEFGAVHRVLQSNHLSLGSELGAFEKQFAHYVGTKHAIAVSSGTAALHLSLIATGIGDGDLIITSPFSFVASANCALYERAIPVFVDVEPLTGNIDVRLVRAAAAGMTQGGPHRRPWLPPALRDASDPYPLKGILPIHAFGQPADMSSIVEIARLEGLHLIEDACEALGAEHQGQRVGTFGDLSCFAFYPNKQMTTGEGGMIVTDEESYARLCASLRNQGRDVFDAWLTHTRLGYNYRLNELSCALGLVQLKRIDELIAKRARVAAWYSERLRDVEGVAVPAVTAATSRMSWFVYVVRLESADERTRTMSALAERGIPSRPYFTPIHLQPFYVEKFGYQRGAFPVAEALGDTSLALPFSSVMTEAQVDFVCQVLVAVLHKQAIRHR